MPAQFTDGSACKILAEKQFLPGSNAFHAEDSIAQFFLPVARDAGDANDLTRKNGEINRFQAGGGSFRPGCDPDQLENRL